MDTEYLSKLSDLMEIPILMLNANCEIVFSTDKGLHHHLGKNTKFYDSINKISKKKTCPFFYLEDDQIYYGVMRVETDYVIFGPVSRNVLRKEHLEAYKHMCMLQKETVIRQYSVMKMAKLLVLVYERLTGQIHDYHEVEYLTSKDDIDLWSSEEDIEDYVIDYTDNEKGHASMAYENRILSMVRAGDVDAVLQSLSSGSEEFDVEKNGGDVALNLAKKIEYYVIVWIALISRAAIEGGLRPEISLTLSDVYMRKVEACKDTQELMMIGAKAQLEFTKCVQEAKRERSKYVYIEECKDYIAKNLRKPMKVGDIAPAIGVNRSYLTRRFKENEGMSIQQYIIRERCSHAANLLKFSDYPISIISEYFCFSSQSHFGKQFKMIYGMTPNEYRSKNKYVTTN